MKKLIAMLLCIALVFSLSTVAFAAEVADIRIEAEKPSAKAVHTEFHKYSWEPEGSTKGVDHTNRVLDADGLEYANAEKTIINFAYLDSYTYTVDATAGAYELHALLDCDRDIEIHYTVNGGAEVKSNTYLGHTNGAGYAGKMEDQLLGIVELVEGSNTLSFTAKAQEANVNIQMDAYVLVPVAPDPEILKGTPVVDGKLDDLYKESYSFTINNKDFASLAAQGDTDDLEATLYILHDGEYLYVCAVVTGDSEIYDTNKSWPLDGVDLWFLQADPSTNLRTKITLEAHGSPSGEFNANQHENEVFGREPSVDMSKVVNAATQDQAGKTYVTEAKFPIPWASESEGTIVINVQLNNAYSNGNYGSYGEQYGVNTDYTTIILSDTEAKVETPDPEPTTPNPDDSNAETGDTISVFVAMMAVSAVGMAVVIGKKKEF